MRATVMGLDVVKFFPAEASGGLDMIKAISAPFPGLRFIPTGGISTQKPGALPRRVQGRRSRRLVDGQGLPRACQGLAGRSGRHARRGGGGQARSREPRLRIAQGHSTGRSILSG